MNIVLTRCLLCNASALVRDHKTAWSLNLAKPHDVSRCKECGFRFVNPRPSEEDFATFYKGGIPATLAPYAGGAPEYYAEEDQKRIEEFRFKLMRLAALMPGRRLLEIGSCTGLFVREAENLGFDVVGTEPSEANVERAMERYGIRLARGGLETLHFTPSTYDGIYAGHVLEHLWDPRSLPRLALRWLRPAGVLMVEVPNQVESFAARRARLLAGGYQRERSFLSIHHTSFFSPSTLKFLLESEGYVQVRVRSVYYDHRAAFSPMKLLARILNPLVGGAGVIECTGRKPS